MNKYLKFFLIFIGILILLVALFVGSFWWSMKNMAAREDRDSAKCDSVSIIAEMPPITLIGFKKKEISQLEFYMVRNGKIIKDTVTNKQLTGKGPFDAEIPFTNFFKTDTVILKTSSKHYYTISGFHYNTYLHHGMFGYLGTYDCRLAETGFINGKEGNFNLLKKDAVRENSLLKQSGF